MSTALALIDNSQYELMAKLAKVAALSTYTKQSEVQAMFVMLKGFELGISPMQALDGIQVIQGKTTVSPQLMLALINRSGQLEDIKIDGDAKVCTVMMKRVGRSPHTETFSMENAKAMGLADKDNYRKQPAVMLKWRAVSACARIVFSDVIQGLYTPEEMGAEVSEDASGELVISTPATILTPEFDKSDNDPTALVSKNPEPDTVDDIVDGEISSDTSLNSSAAPEPATNTPEQAKARLNGNGAPASGEKKVIGKDAKKAAPGWRDSSKTATEVFTAVRPLYNATEHMQNSIAKLEAAGKLTPDMNVELAIATIRNHKDETVAPF